MICFLAQNIEECDLELMFYIILRGYLRFHHEYNSYPGATDVEPDISRFKVHIFFLSHYYHPSQHRCNQCLLFNQATVTKVLNEWNTSIVPREDCIHEICRYGGSEIPSVAAFIGKIFAYKLFVFSSTSCSR